MAEEHHTQIKQLVDNHLLYVITRPLQAEIIALYHERKHDIIELFGQELVERLLIVSFGGFEKYIEQWIYLDPRPNSLEVEKEFRQFLAIVHT